MGRRCPATLVSNLPLFKFETGRVGSIISCAHETMGIDGMNRALLTGEGEFDIVILSDLLHFHASHDVLLGSLTRLLARTPSARTYVGAGKYTRPEVCSHFLSEGAKLGLVWEEVEEDPVWRGQLPVSGGQLDREQLGVRKGMCRAWIGRWSDAMAQSHNSA